MLCIHMYRNTYLLIDAIKNSFLNSYNLRKGGVKVAFASDVHGVNIRTKFNFFASRNI